MWHNGRWRLTVTILCQPLLRLLCRNFPRLSENCRKRLAIENDDKANMYSVKDLLTLNARIGVPITFDFHHHVSCLPAGAPLCCMRQTPAVNRG